MIKTVVRMSARRSRLPWRRKITLHFSDGTEALATKTDTVDDILAAYASNRPVDVYFDRRGRVDRAYDIVGGHRPPKREEV